MKKSLVKVKTYRRFSEEFKLQMVKEYESGVMSVRQLGRAYHLKPQLIYNWIYKYSTFNEKSIKVVEMSESSSEKMKALEVKVKELEQMVGRKQIKLEFMEKMAEIAKERYNIDITKNSFTPPSDGSEKTKKK
jgi:transposase